MVGGFRKARKDSSSHDDIIRTYFLWINIVIMNKSSADKPLSFDLTNIVVTTQIIKLYLYLKELN